MKKYNYIVEKQNAFLCPINNILQILIYQWHKKIKTWMKI